MLKLGLVTPNSIETQLLWGCVSHFRRRFTATDGTRNVTLRNFHKLSIIICNLIEIVTPQPQITCCKRRRAEWTD